MKNSDTYPTLAFETQQDWETWLEQHHSEARTPVKKSGRALKLSRKLLRAS